MNLLVCLLIYLIKISPTLSNYCQTLINDLRVSNQESALEILKRMQIEKCFIQIVPRYKWSQNMSHIQVKIQFPVGSSSTTCDEKLYEDKSVDHNMFEARVLCYNKPNLINYYLRVVTFKSLNFQLAQWKNVEQNNLVFQCLKSPAPYFWPILHSRTAVPERGPKVWWDMLSKFGSELRPVIDMLEIGDNDIEVSRKIKKKKKEDKRVQGINYFCRKGRPQYLGSWL